MNITFLIGNGFDINLGLPTKYIEFLKYHNSKNYSDMISKSIRDDLALWSDVELELGAFTKDVSVEDIEAFLDAKDNLDRSLIEYLNSICSQYIIQFENGGIEEFRDKIVGFGKEFNRTDRDNLSSLIYNTREPINYQFITFNYTHYLDVIVNNAKKLSPFNNHSANGLSVTDAIQEPIHIHGQLGTDMIFGVNDHSQLDCSVDVEEQLSEYMIKNTLNRAVGEKKVSRTEEIIDKSEYICVYGMSLGKTDLMWWKYLIKWLKSSASHRLVLYKHLQDNTILSASANARRRNSVRKEFIALAGEGNEDSKLTDRIIVIPKTEVFTYKKIKVVKQNG